MSIKIFISLLYQLQSARSALTYPEVRIRDAEKLSPPDIELECGRIQGRNQKIRPSSYNLYPVTQEIVFRHRF